MRARGWQRLSMRFMRMAWAGIKHDFTFDKDILLATARAFAATIGYRGCQSVLIRSKSKQMKIELYYFPTYILH
jgi:hypothetical protein